MLNIRAAPEGSTTTGLFSRWRISSELRPLTTNIMESPPAADAPAPTFSQVVFTNIPRSYPPSTPITCCYNLTAPFQPHPRDWVGIFKVGWSTAKDYHTFVWVEPCHDVVKQEGMTRQAVFKEYYLPKDEVEFYQFCYVDNSGQVRGASTPFSFKTEEQSMESSGDDDLLVITTQEQVEQSVREKAELQKQLDLIKAENETLKSSLQKEQQDSATLKGQNEESEKQRNHLVKELDQIKEENGKLKTTVQQQRQEMDGLKEEMLVQKVKQLEIEQQQNMSSNTASSLKESLSQEKYDRAVMKINQLKDERAELKGKIDAQMEEISKLNVKVREGEREFNKVKDNIELLQVDLQSSEKEKDRLSLELQRLQRVAHNMDEVKRENQELCRKLTLQDTPPQGAADEDIRAQNQSLNNQLLDVQAKLAAEKEKSRETKRRVESLELELMHVKDQLDSVITSCDQEQRKSGKFELQLREACEGVADRDTRIEEMNNMMRLMEREKEELARENQSLISDLENLRRVNSDLCLSAAVVVPPAAPSSPGGNTSTNQPPDQDDLLGEPIGNVEEPEEEMLVCRHCQESFPGITRGELEQHEQSHRVCPFCTMICDNMEQAVFEDHVYGHEV